MEPLYTLTEILYVWWNVAVSWARRFDNRSKALLEIFIGSTWIFQSLIHHCFGTRSETQHSKHHETNPKHLHDLIHHTEQKPEIVASTCPILLHYSTCSWQFRIHILLNENWQNFWPPWAKKAPTSWRYHITWRQWCWRGPILSRKLVLFLFSQLSTLRDLTITSSLCNHNKVKKFIFATGFHPFDSLYSQTQTHCKINPNSIGTKRASPFQDHLLLLASSLGPPWLSRILFRKSI